MSAVMGIHSDSRLLRSRTRTGESTEWWSSADLDPPILGREASSLGLERRIIQAARFRVRFTRVKILFIIAAVSLACFGYIRFIRVSTVADSGRVSKSGIRNQTKAKISKAMKTYDLAVRPHTVPSEGSSRVTPSRPWRYPLVDRKILGKLDRMQEFFDEDYGLFPLAVKSAADSRFRWPPIVTSVPERVSRPSVDNANTIKPDGSNAICESAKHPRPCRFLLPLRISEQESKARLHFSQIAQLAKRLNRTLVLPNVGKSKIGTCFKWPFSTYYDSAFLNDTGIDGLESSIDLEPFRVWVENRDRRRKGPLRSQLVSIGSGLPVAVGPVLRREAIFSNEDISAYAYTTFGAWERDLPGCFSSKFDNLKLETRPIFMSAASQVKRDGAIKSIGNSLVDAFSAVSPGAPRDPAVLVVNWDLRYPVFEPSSSDRPLQYSTRMHDLALRYAPKGPYLVVQWRMETVDVEVLKECAHALVDVLVRVLGDHVLSENVTTVWFASDYPYPIANRGKPRPPAVAAKSGTFKDFEVRHEEAIEILRTAFHEHGELEKWKLTDFAESVERDKHSPIDLIEDPGVMGILDKIVSTKADLFVSGSTQCSRKRYAVAKRNNICACPDQSSSFTKQVIDARRAKLDRNMQSHLKNIVDVFG